ncbi:hypothetical protein LguiB_033211 [Lonicera macranthoides]
MYCPRVLREGKKVNSSSENRCTVPHEKVIAKRKQIEAKKKENVPICCPIAKRTSLGHARARPLSSVLEKH